MKYMKGVLEDLGKTVVKDECVMSCCPEAIMNKALDMHVKPIVSEIDGLVIVSCMGGVKSANICRPGIPVFAACDAEGVRPLTARGESRKDLLLHNVCSSCDDGHCVISFTGGICPVTGCPLGIESRYGPCDRAREYESEKCYENPHLDCIWTYIKKEAIRRGLQLSLLEKLKEIHFSDNYVRSPTFEKPT